MNHTHSRDRSSAIGEVEVLRVQLLLEKEQHRRLEDLSKRTGRSRSSLVREALDALLRRMEDDAIDPLLALIGQAGPAGRDDLSERHDEILVEAARDAEN